MLKNIKFLAGVVGMTLIISPFFTNYASANYVTDQDINHQESEVRTASREAIEQYTRLLLYIIIFRLENKLQSQ